MQLSFKLSGDRRFDVVGFGVNAVDHLIVVPEYPAFDTKVRFLQHALSAGGQTSSAMVGLQRLGLKTAYAGRFGSDTAGKYGLQTLKDEGVEVEFAELIAGASNQIAFIFIDSRNGERTIVWDRDDRLAYTRDDAPVAFASLGSILHIDAHDPPACVSMAEAARAAGTIVSADIDNIYDGLPELLPLIDILITSKEFPERLMGIRDERNALLELKSRYGCSLVGITRGVAGALAYCNEVFFESPAYEVPGGCRDTTGAGDAFHAGFIYGVLKESNLEECLRLGNAVASLKCRALGARASLPTHDELYEFLKRV